MEILSTITVWTSFLLTRGSQTCREKQKHHTRGHLGASAFGLLLFLMRLGVVWGGFPELRQHHLAEPHPSLAWHLSQSHYFESHDGFGGLGQETGVEDIIKV